MNEQLYVLHEEKPGPDTARRKPVEHRFLYLYDSFSVNTP